MTPSMRTLLHGFAAAIAVAFSVNASAEVNADAAKNLARVNHCFKCHSVEKGKDGPSYREVAEKYRGKADAEEKLIIHLTTGKKVKFSDGHEDEHRTLKTRDMNKIRNLVGWILAQ